jgi:hypothetical protein
MRLDGEAPTVHIVAKAIGLDRPLPTLHHRPVLRPLACTGWVDGHTWKAACTPSLAVLAALDGDSKTLLLKFAGEYSPDASLEEKESLPLPPGAVLEADNHVASVRDLPGGACGDQHDGGTLSVRLWQTADGANGGSGQALVRMEGPPSLNIAQVAHWEGCASRGSGDEREIVCGDRIVARLSVADGILHIDSEPASPTEHVHAALLLPCGGRADLPNGAIPSGAPGNPNYRP